MNPNLTFLQQQGYQYLIQGNYTKAVELYEQAAEKEPDVKSHYWHLGLVLLLQGQETEAQTTWLLAMAEGEAEQVEEWTAELIQVLETEAKRQEELADNAVAWVIRQHLREIVPTDINNLLHLINLAVKQEMLTDEELASTGIVELLREEQPLDVEPTQLLLVLESVLSYAPWYESLLEFAAAGLPHIYHLPEVVAVWLKLSQEIAYSMAMPAIAASLLEIYLSIAPNNPEMLRQLSAFHDIAGNHSAAIAAAKQCYSLLKTLPEQVYGNYMVLRSLMSAGVYWEEATSVFQQQQLLLQSIVEENLTTLNRATALRLVSSTFFLPYFKDEPRSNRQIQNQIGQIFQSNVENYAKETVERYRQKLSVLNRKKTPGSRLKIGYLSFALRKHSVGWLARWLLKHHDTSRFEVHGYFVNATNIQDPLQNWYINQVEKSYRCGFNSLEIAEQIHQDEIDILIELDSITLDTSYEVMALKPAPIQVSWLGLDAAGIRNVDYFIADPYVLPESAPDYYAEKIWRLPQTYIAVDGFEVYVPTLRRDKLDIPTDAVIYLSIQRGYKQHPETARLQMKILKQVPNSYLLIKGVAEEAAQKEFFGKIAEAEGVSSERLRFLPEVATEEVHRANLGIADIVLDTYPYNGATTTLETLWMGVPMVTRVGKQFASRNSYTMMMNAGVTEGIAWTDEEYIEWGVKLGKDENLRHSIAWKLKASRQTSPLWNAEKFTREMEKAYEQMWVKYVEESQ
jgi:predicted O-linked N-acetylglucosamine transferase (SPINDLY family)